MIRPARVLAGLAAVVVASGAALGAVDRLDRWTRRWRYASRDDWLRAVIRRKIARGQLHDHRPDEPATASCRACPR